MERRQYLSGQRTVVLIALIGLLALVAPSAGATPHPRQSVNVAIIGSPSVINGGQLVTTGPAGELGDFVFANLDPASVSTANLSPFDTVVLNVASREMNCDTATLSATAKTDLVSFVGGGHKMVIYDSECAAGAGADYSWLPFPFTTNNPGGAGAFGTLTIVEENLLSTSDSADPHFIDTAYLGSSTDAVGDANVFVTNDPNWCVDMSAANTNGVTGAVHTYAKYPTGTDTGLFIYNGLDVDVMGGETNANGLQKIWLQELQHPTNPSALPCGITVVGITLSPASASNVVGSSHTVTASLADLLGNPKPGIAVSFTVVSGPNVGVTGNSTTDASGQTIFAYTGSGGVGTDKVQACFDNQGTKVCSTEVTKEWTAQPNNPCTITGTAGNDVLRGTPGDDVICGLGGDDKLDGKRGNDKLLGGDGNDKLRDDIGNDELLGEAGDDYLDAERGDDRLDGGDGNDYVDGGSGNDELQGGSGSDTLDGEQGDDKLLGGDGNDKLKGGSGKDELAGEAGDDRLDGERGDDTLLGGDGNDKLKGGSGKDRLEGGLGDDHLYGDSGEDVLNGDSGDDALNGGRQNDALDGGQGNDDCNGGSATDTAAACEVVTRIP
jgi:Ca2+-binding RTX toxin-like protein